jgi:predicted transcriptional regulator
MARKSIDAFGALQTAVMETLWELGEATVGQVRERLKRDPEPAYTTILSVMQKLEKTGWLTHRAEGRTYVYRPTRSRNEAGATTLRSFIDRVFRGDPLLLFQHLLDDEELTEQDFSALKRMIEQKRRKEGRQA